MTTAKTTRKTKSTSPKLPSSSKSKRRAVVTPKIDSLPTNPFVFEILDLASQQRSVAKKIETLKTYEHNSIKSILIWNFDPSVISLLPEGEVPYGESEDQQLYKGTLSDNIKREAAGGESATGQDLDGRGRTSLRREWQNLYHFVKGGNDTLNATRREMMFINLLRKLHPREAEVLILTKDKDLGTKYNVTIDNVKQAFPKMTWGN